MVSQILIEVNIGNEPTKSGFEYAQVESAYKKIAALPHICVKGLMAMLPESDNESLLRELAAKMRILYDRLNAQGANFEYLSMGMSGDWKLCIDEGSNMIRLGTAIFGKRNYKN